MQSQKSGIRLRHLQQKSHVPIHHEGVAILKTHVQNTAQLNNQKYQRQQSVSPYGQRKKIFDPNNLNYSQSNNSIAKVIPPLSILNEKVTQNMNANINMQNANVRNMPNHPYQYEQLLSSLKRKNTELQQKTQIIQKLQQRVRFLQGENLNYKQQIRKMRFDGIQKANLHLNSQNISGYDDYQRDQKSFRTQTSYNTIKNYNTRHIQPRQCIKNPPVKASHTYNQSLKNNQNGYQTRQPSNLRGIPALPQTPDQRSPSRYTPQKQKLRVTRQQPNSRKFQHQKEGYSGSPYRTANVNRKQDEPFHQKNYSSNQRNGYIQRQNEQATVSVLRDSDNQYQQQVQKKDIVSPLMALDSKKGHSTKNNSYHNQNTNFNSSSNQFYPRGNGFNGQNSFGRNRNEDYDSNTKRKNPPTSKNLHIDDSLQFRFDDNNSELSDFHSGFLF